MLTDWYLKRQKTNEARSQIVGQKHKWIPCSKNLLHLLSQRRQKIYCSILVNKLIKYFVASVLYVLLYLLLDVQVLVVSIARGLAVALVIVALLAIVLVFVASVLYVALILLDVEVLVVYVARGLAVALALVALIVLVALLAILVVTSIILLFITLERMQVCRWCRRIHWAKVACPKLTETLLKASICVNQSLLATKLPLIQ